MIGAKSFSDHGSGSAGGGGSMPDVATLDSLTVQRPEGREDTIHVQYEQEAILVTDQAADERGRLPKSKLRGGLHFLGRELQHVRDPVDQQAGDLDVAARRSTRRSARREPGPAWGPWQAERHPQVVDRHDVARRLITPSRNFGPPGTSVSDCMSSTSCTRITSSA